MGAEEEGEIMVLQKIHLRDIPDDFYVKILDEKTRTNIFEMAKNNLEGEYNNIATLINIDRRRLQKWRKGTRFMPMEFLKKTCHIANINLVYLENKSNIGLKGDSYCRDYLPIEFPVSLNEDWAYFSQLINTDGHVASNLKMIEIANNDTGVLERLKKFLESVGVPKRSINEKEWNKGKYLKIYSRSFVRLLCFVFNIKAGKKFDVIRMPEVIKNSSKPVIASALRGAFDGDGWVVERTRRIGINSKSRQYMKDIHELLLLFNIESYVRGPDKRGRYLCEITRYSNVKKYQDFIGFCNEKRKKKLEEIANLLSRYPIYSTLEAHDIILEKIKEKKTIDAEKISLLIQRGKNVSQHHLKNLYNHGKLNRIKTGKKFIYSLPNNVKGD